MNADGLIITGTDTGVGKTIVTGLLAHCLGRMAIDVGVMKPVASGGTRLKGRSFSPDALFLKDVLDLADPLELINPVCFCEPLAPAVAARLTGAPVDFDLINRAFEELSRAHDVVLVEGVGGLMVPLGGGKTVADLALEWELPLLIVARPGLGTINHTALSVSHARSVGLKVMGVLFNAREPLKNDAAEKTNPSCVEEFCGIRHWGTVPFGGEMDNGTDEWDRLCILGGRILKPLAKAISGRL